ncbi:MAG: hypothetical protein L0Z62_31620 [Gemmataceae bacterium]|nr:hypothetical protein [Gemmataceae bacterium]
MADRRTEYGKDNGGYGNDQYWLDSNGNGAIDLSELIAGPVSAELRGRFRQLWQDADKDPAAAGVRNLPPGSNDRQAVPGSSTAGYSELSLFVFELSKEANDESMTHVKPPPFGLPPSSGGSETPSPAGPGTPAPGGSSTPPSRIDKPGVQLESTGIEEKIF